MLIGVFFWQFYLSMPLLILLIILVSFAIYNACRYKGDTAEQIAYSMREFYMTGIVANSSESCITINDKLEAFINPQRHISKRLLMCFPTFIIISSLSCVALSLASHYVFNSTILTIAFALLSIILIFNSILSILTIFTNIANTISTLLLRITIVLLEMIYIPVAEAVIDLLHPYKPCDVSVCVATADIYKIVERNFTCCFSNSTGDYANWEKSPFQQPWLNYKNDIILSFSPFIVYTILAILIGIPVLEYYIGFKCVKILENVYTTGDNTEEKYEDVLSNLKTPIIYTFFMYKKKFIYIPALIFLYKASVATISHIQIIYNINYILAIFLSIVSLLSIITHVHKYILCQILDVLMYILSTLVSILPNINILAENTTIISIAKGAASCIPITVFIIVSIILAVRKKRLQQKDEIEIENICEDGDVVRERMKNLYENIDKIINKEVSNILSLYGKIVCIFGGISLGYFIGYIIKKR